MSLNKMYKPIMMGIIGQSLSNLNHQKRSNSSKRKIKPTTTKIMPPKKLLFCFLVSMMFEGVRVESVEDTEKVDTSLEVGSATQRSK